MEGTSRAERVDTIEVLAAAGIGSMERRCCTPRMREALSERTRWLPTEEGDKGTAMFSDDFEVLDREGCPMAGGESVRPRKALPCAALMLVGAPLALVGTGVGIGDVQV